jgi:hypothetical protein
MPADYRDYPLGPLDMDDTRDGLFSARWRVRSYEFPD